MKSILIIIIALMGYTATAQHGSFASKNLATPPIIDTASGTITFGSTVIDIHALVATYVPAIEDDFYIASPALDITTAAIGASITMSFNASYTGNSTSTHTATFRYYLSTDNVWDPADTQVGTDNATIGSADLFDPESAVYTVAAGTTPGSYYILFVADPLDAFTETDESNNVAAVALTITN